MERESPKDTGTSNREQPFTKCSFVLEYRMTDNPALVQYRLKDGSKIHASSALLLQLIHTCAERPVVDPVSVDFQELERPAQKIEMQKVRQFFSVCYIFCQVHSPNPTSYLFLAL